MEKRNSCVGKKHKYKPVQTWPGIFVWDFNKPYMNKKTRKTIMSKENIVEIFKFKTYNDYKVGIHSFPIFTSQMVKHSSFALNPKV